MLYHFLRSLLRAVFFLLGLKIVGQENVPKEGPVVVASNHLSNWDPIMVGLAVTRPVCFMAKSSLFNFKPVGWLLRALHAFPVDKGKGDLHAIRVALDVLSQERVLGIFPEGQRNLHSQELKAQPGVAMLAFKSNAVVLPVACTGSQRTFPIGWFTPLRVVIGKPIYLQLGKDQKANSKFFEQASQEILLNIHALL